MVRMLHNLLFGGLVVALKLGLCPNFAEKYMCPIVP